MKKYKVYFEFYGKKWQTTVEANSQQEAKDAIRGKIIFHKIEQQKGKSIQDLSKEGQDLMDIFFKGFKK